MRVGASANVTVDTTDQGSELVALADAPSAGRADRILTSVAVLLAVLMVILDMTVVNVALPHMMGALGATPDQITWVITSYIVAEAIVIPTSGFLAARFGASPWSS